MKFNLEMDELQDLDSSMVELLNAIETFQSDIDGVIDVLTSEYSGETFNSVISNLNSVQEMLAAKYKSVDEIEETLYEYLKGIDNANSHLSSPYKLNTNKLKNACEKIEKLSSKDLEERKGFESKIENFEQKIVKYQNALSDIDYEKDYKDDAESIKALVSRLESQNDQDISNFKRNVNTYESAVNLLKTFKDELESNSKPFELIKEKLEALEDFENSFDPGFWAKYGGAITFVVSVAVIFVSTPLVGYLMVLEFALTIANGDGLLVAVIGLLPFDKMLGPIGKKLGKKFITKADDIAEGMSKVGKNKLPGNDFITRKICG